MTGTLSLSWFSNVERTQGTTGRGEWNVEDPGRAEVLPPSVKEYYLEKYLEIYRGVSDTKRPLGTDRVLPPLTVPSLENPQCHRNRRTPIPCPEVCL